ILAGLQPGELTVLAAASSVGKTTFLVNIARHLAIEEGFPVLIVSLQHSQIQFAERIMCCQARVDTQRFRTGRMSSDEVGRLIEASTTLRRAKLFIDDHDRQTAATIFERARLVHAEHRLAAILIDSYEVIEPEDPSLFWMAQIERTTRSLSQHARALAIP